jgi:hypothetical protein
MMLLLLLLLLIMSRSYHESSAQQSSSIEGTHGSTRLIGIGILAKGIALLVAKMQALNGTIWLTHLLQMRLQDARMKTSNENSCNMLFERWIRRGMSRTVLRRRSCCCCRGNLGVLSFFCQRRVR